MSETYVQIRPSVAYSICQLFDMTLKDTGGNPHRKESVHKYNSILPVASATHLIQRSRTWMEICTVTQVRATSIQFHQKHHQFI